MRFYVNSVLFLTWIALFELGVRWSELFYCLILLVQFFFLDKLKRFRLNYFITVVLIYASLSTLFTPSFFVTKFLLIYSVLFLTTLDLGDLKMKSIRLVNFLVFLSFFVTCLNKPIEFNVAWSSFLTSDFSSFENNSHPFLFLFFGLFFLIKGEFWMWALNFLLVVLSFKRIVVVTFIVSIPIIYYRIYLTNFFKWSMRFLPFMFLSIPFVLTSTYIEDVVYESTGLYLSHITQGRSSFYDGIISEFYSWRIFLIGHGSGVVTEWSINTFDYLIHNDFLKIFLEFGIIGFILLFSLLRRSLHPVFYFALLLLFLTDNVFIYIYIFYFIFNLNLIIGKEV